MGKINDRIFLAFTLLCRIYGGHARMYNIVLYSHIQRTCLVYYEKLYDDMTGIRVLHLSVKYNLLDITLIVRVLIFLNME